MCDCIPDLSCSIQDTVIFMPGDVWGENGHHIEEEDGQNGDGDDRNIPAKRARQAVPIKQVEIITNTI